jgi:hypothetical protein
MTSQPDRDTDFAALVDALTRAEVAKAQAAAAQSFACYLAAVVITQAQTIAGAADPTEASQRATRAAAHRAGLIGDRSITHARARAVAQANAIKSAAAVLGTSGPTHAQRDADVDVDVDHAWPDETDPSDPDCGAISDPTLHGEPAPSQSRGLGYLLGLGLERGTEIALALGFTPEQIAASEPEPDPEPEQAAAAVVVPRTIARAAETILVSQGRLSKDSTAALDCQVMAVISLLGADSVDSPILLGALGLDGKPGPVRRRLDASMVRLAEQGLLVRAGRSKSFSRVTTEHPTEHPSTPSSEPRAGFIHPRDAGEIVAWATDSSRKRLDSWGARSLDSLIGRAVFDLGPAPLTMARLLGALEIDGSDALAVGRVLRTLERLEDSGAITCARSGSSRSWSRDTAPSRFEALHSSRG